MGLTIIGPCMKTMRSCLMYVFALSWRCPVQQLLPNPPWSDGVLRRQAQCLSFSVGFLLFCRPSHLCSHRRGNPRYRHRARASSKPVELAQDLDAQDPEMAVEASYSSGAFSLTSTLWPPKQVITDIGKLTPIQAEASVGRYTGAAPPLPEWPFYESQMSLEELQALDAKDEEMLKRLTFVDFADQLTRAYVLASRWQKSNLGRSAGFDRLGIGILSGFMFTNPVLMRQLQGLNVLQNYVAEKCQDDAPEDEAPRKTRLPAASPETFAAFLRSVEAGETIAAEFAAVAPVERETFVEGLVSSQGSALAMWTQEPESGLAEVHFCIGHDCLKEGPEVEDLLMRLVARKAQAQGAQRLRARARFTEKGKLLVPCPKLQFQLAPGEREFAEDASDAEAMSNRDFTKPKDYYAIPEAVEGLRTWLLVLCLEDRLEEANGWCQEMGAATLDEVIESREDLAEYLEQQAPLTAGEKQALLERDH
ncbi:unnamed protein product [Durusdinium trenchii]|uniref:Uncharacterized protein n=1 Tax=Durusdinium trenchii TaxID=1381693 RepID=A0ABP0KMD0_9DINO